MAGMAAALGAALGVMVCIKKGGTVVEIRLEPKAALELAIAIAKKARAFTQQEKLGKR